MSDLNEASLLAAEGRFRSNDRLRIEVLGACTQDDPADNADLCNLKGVGECGPEIDGEILCNLQPGVRYRFIGRFPAGDNTQTFNETVDFAELAEELPGVFLAAAGILNPPGWQVTAAGHRVIIRRDIQGSTNVQLFRCTWQ
jgi:hypothetical protein